MNTPINKTQTDKKDSLRFLVFTNDLKMIPVSTVAAQLPNSFAIRLPYLQGLKLQSKFVHPPSHHYPE